MAKPTLIIGNRNYSSWSLRGHMTLAGFGIDYDARLVPFGPVVGAAKFAKAIRPYSKAGLVPVLKHNGIAVWDTLAIAEYLAETFPKKQMWPKNKAARAMARSISAEMHSGLRALRSEMPMNIRRAPKPIALSAAAKKDISRVEDIWAEARRRYGNGGPFLFGKFSIADVMFTPVASRFATFAVPVSATSRRYMDAVLNTPAYQAWQAMALKERWIVPEDEVD